MIESKSFYRRIESVFDALGETRTRAALAERLAPRLLDGLGGVLGVVAAHVYAPGDDGPVASKRWGASRPDLRQRLRDHLDAHGAADSPWPALLETPAGRAGVIEVGAPPGPLIALFAAGAGELGAAPSRADFVSALNSLTYALGQHLGHRELRNVFEQARVIQLSLLPPGRPAFADFDLCAASVPAQRVGGDLYDFIAMDDEALAIAVADASGHGLSAALQARDVAMGLRMGMERDLKLTRLAEKLNRIIHRSGLVTRFVSLVFGELGANGNFEYINAGHPPPLLLDDHGLHELTVGGPILGPVADARYKLGFAHVDRGATLALFSDGVIECASRDGREFGVDGVKAWLRDWREGPGDAAIADLFQRLETLRGRPEADDDVTALYVRRPREISPAPRRDG